MKKIYIAGLPLVLLLSGCLGRKKNQETVIRAEQQEIVVDSKRTTIFLDEADDKNNDQDVQDFVFEEEATEDAFSSKAETEVQLVDADNATENTIDQSVVFKTIYFDFDKFSLGEEQKISLDHNLTNVKKHVEKGDTIVVEGHSCNSAGSDAYNVLLSEKRAQEVAKYLIEQGVSADKLKVVGRGNEMAIVPFGTRAQQAPNRRVELHIVKKN